MAEVRATLVDGFNNLLGIDEPLYDRYLEALLLGQGARAWSLVEDALADGMTPEAILFEVLPAVQREVGRLWHRNELSVGEEHFVTQTTRRTAGRLVDRVVHHLGLGGIVGRQAGADHR